MTADIEWITNEPDDPWAGLDVVRERPPATEPSFVGPYADRAEKAADKVAAQLAGLAQRAAAHQADEPEPYVHTWTPVDLAAHLDSDPEQPTMLTRGDGAKLIYPGRTSWLVGESESCKSWLALIAVAEVLNDGGRAMWVDYEDTPALFVRRLLELGVDRDVAVSQNLVYVAPEGALTEPNGAYTAEGAGYLDTIRAGFDIAVIDASTGSFGTQGLEIIDNSDIERWYELMCAPLERTGAGVLVIDHVTKSTEGRGRYMIGGERKLSKATGAVFKLDVERPFYPARLDPVEGQIEVRVGKDRAGGVRANAVGAMAADRTQRMAWLNLTAYPDGRIGYELAKPTDTPTDTFDAKLAGAIAEHLATYEGASKTDVEKSVGAKAERVRATLKAMADKGWIDVEQSGQTHRHTLTDEGREACLP